MKIIKKIYIILSKTDTIFAKGIRVYTKACYSHSSICLDDNFENFYSFGRKYTSNPFIGCFVKENLNKGLFSLFDNIPCKVLEIDVTKEQYDLICNEIKLMEKEFNKYKYNYLGIIFAMANKPHSRQNRYYCSEFMYYLLKKGEVLTNEFDKTSVSPNDLDNLNFKVFYEGNLKKISKKERLVV